MPSGAGAYAKYGYETTFKTAVTANKVFGVGTKLDRDENNNMIKIYSLGQRVASNVVSTAFTGKAGLEFVLSNPWFLQAVFGVAPTTTGVGPYTHYYVDTANVNGGGAINIADKAPSMTIENAINISGTNDPVSKLLGTVVDTWTLTLASNDTVKCKLDAAFADVDYTKAGSYTASSILDTFDPYIYSYGNLQLPDGTNIANVTNATVTFKNGNQMITGIGARGASAYVSRQLDIDIKATVLFDTTVLLEKFYGGAGPFSTLPLAPTETTLTIVLDNGLLTTSQRTITIKFAKAWINQSTIRQAVEEAMMQNISLVTIQPTLVKALDNTATPP